MSAATFDPMQHDDRTFYYAVGASLVFHALLLFALPGLREGRSTPEIPGVLVARIVEPPRVVPTAAPPQAPAARPPEPPEPRVETPPKPPPPVRKPSPLAERPAEPAPPPPVTQPAPPSTEPQPPTPPSTVASVPSPATPGAQAETPPRPADAYQGSLRDYEAQLSFMAGRFKRYPRVAVDNAWEGNVEVELLIGANGVLRSVKVVASSGYNVLDQQAIEMFKQAKPRVPIPPALVGREFSVTRRVTFELKEGG